jgi:hypothetical protein
MQELWPSFSILPMQRTDVQMPRVQDAQERPTTLVYPRTA